MGASIGISNKTQNNQDNNDTNNTDSAGLQWNWLNEDGTMVRNPGDKKIINPAGGKQGEQRYGTQF